jgi:hypothetical protein
MLGNFTVRHPLLCFNPALYPVKFLLASKLEILSSALV